MEQYHASHTISSWVVSQCFSAVKLIPYRRDDIVPNITQRSLSDALSDNATHCDVTKRELT